MANNKITIVLVNTLQFNIQRRNDKCIMDELTRGLSSINQLIQINACRFYLNIIHLSDIVNPDGNTINNKFLIGYKPNYPSFKLNWSHQKYSSIKAWKLWNTTLRKAFNIQDNLMLKPFLRLGEWLTPEFQRNMTHQCNYFPSRHELTISNPSLTISYFADKVDHESMMINMDSKTTIDELHEDGVPVILETYLFKLLNKFKVTICILSPPPTLSKHIDKLPKWAKTLIQNYKDETLGPSLLELIQNNCDIIIASDGSKSDQKSGGAWIIADSSGTTSMPGSNPGFGLLSSIN